MREVHNWSSRPFWPQGVDRPTEAQPVPEGLDWDLWLGPAPERPFNKAYLPFVWRGWYDFGCGSFGDMGCYSFAGVFKILDLTPPVRWRPVQRILRRDLSEGVHRAPGFPRATAGRGPHGVVRRRLAAAAAGRDERGGPHLFQKGEDNEGIMYVGDKGYHPGRLQRQQSARLSGIEQIQAPPRQRGEQPRAIRPSISGSPPAKADRPRSRTSRSEPGDRSFPAGMPGAAFPGERLEWDTAKMSVTSFERANQYVDPEYRKGYEG